MEWRPVKGYEGIYEINEYGDIFSLNSNKFIRFSFHKKGYVNNVLYKDGRKKKFLNHRLVALNFLDKPKKGQDCINHKNSIRTRNHYSNLEWCTRGENNAHMRKMERQAKGTRLPQSTLTESQVKNIRKIWNKEKGTFKELGDRLGIKPSIIRSICIKETWKHI